MDLKMLLAVIASIWAIWQHFLRRKHVKKDWLLDKRFAVYDNFLKTVKEMSQAGRAQISPGIPNELIIAAYEGNVGEIKKNLLSSNEKFTEGNKEHIDRTLILTQELNSVKLVCSDELLPLIEEYIEALERLPDFRSQMYKVFGEALKDPINLGPKESMQKLLEQTGFENGKEKERIERLRKKIEEMMREEIKGKS